MGQGLSAHPSRLHRQGGLFTLLQAPLRRHLPFTLAGVSTPRSQTLQHTILLGWSTSSIFSFSRPVQTGQGTRYLSLAFGTPTSALRDTTSGTALPYQETTIGRIVSAAISAFSLPAADHLSLGNTLQALLRAGLRSFASRTLN